MSFRLFWHSAYFWWSQNHKMRTVLYLYWPAKRPSEVSYSTDAQPLCFAYVSQNRLLHSCLLFLLSTPVVAQRPLLSQMDFYFNVLLVVRETSLAPKISITFGAGLSDGGESARRRSHIIATRLVTDVCVISYALFVTHFTHKPLPHRARYIHDHMIVSFDVIIE
jgi:hypothetical protein